MQISCDEAWALTWLSPPDYHLWNVTSGSACDCEQTTFINHVVYITAPHTRTHASHSMKAFLPWLSMVIYIVLCSWKFWFGSLLNLPKFLTYLIDIWRSVLNCHI